MNTDAPEFYYGSKSLEIFLRELTESRAVCDTASFMMAKYLLHEYALWAEKYPIQGCLDQDHTVALIDTARKSAWKAMIPAECL